MLCRNASDEDFEVVFPTYFLCGIQRNGNPWSLNQDCRDGGPQPVPFLPQTLDTVVSYAGIQA